MTTNFKRRFFLKGSLAAGTVGAAIGAGLFIPKTGFASWPKAAFTAKNIDDALGAAMNGSQTASSDAIKIKAPDIAENGAVVPVSVKADIKDVESIAILYAGNASPLAASFNLGPGSVPDVSTRIKMVKTGDLVAVVKANGKLLSSRKPVKVTIGGCGG